MNAPKTGYVNRHGRKMGRGLRPWILIPKVLATGGYLGTLIAATVAWFLQRNYRIAGESVMEPKQLVDQLSMIFRIASVPLLLFSLGFGLILLNQHMRVFLRMRWVQLKLAILAIFIPCSHFYMAAKFKALRSALILEETYKSTIEQQISIGLVVVILITILVIWLGRHKPRLAQNWAKTFEKANK